MIILFYCQILTQMTTPRDAPSSGHSGQPARMYFKLDTVTGPDALHDIKSFTGDFNEKCKLTKEFIDNLTSTLESTENLFHGFLYAPKDANVTRQVIGKNGCYFHKTTTDCNIYFVWHNRQNNCFEFWGQKKELIRAMNIIHSRIRKCSQSSQETTN